MPGSAEFGVPDRVPVPARRSAPVSRLGRWLLQHQVQPVGPEAAEAHAKPQAWWKVMCLTGVDYFSTLSYLPGIAALAAGALSPLATLLIVALTLLGMLPMYRRVARGEPARAGVGGDAGEAAAVLAGQDVRAGAARVRGHVVDHHDHPVGGRRHRAPAGEPVPARVPARHRRWSITVVLLLILGGVFLLGFSEAVGVAIPLVAVFLGLNAVIVVVGLVEVVHHPGAHVRVDGRADRGRRRVRRHRRPGAAGVPAAGARAVRVRDRCQHDAAGRRRRRRRRTSGCGRGSATPASCSPPPR